MLAVPHPDHYRDESLFEIHEDNILFKCKNPGAIYMTSPNPYQKTS